MPKNFTHESTSTENDRALTINNDAFYKVVMKGVFAGQANNNIFYYRVGLGLLPGGLNFGGAEAMAWTFKNQVWTGNIKDLMSNLYTLQEVVVYPYNGAFDPSVQLPYTLAVNETGASSGTTPSSASCVIVKANLEGQTLGVNGWFPPKRAYWAIGPHKESDVDDTGRLTTTARAWWAQKTAILGQDLVNLTSLVTFWPCKIAQRSILGVSTLYGFSDISGVTIREVVRWRSSRVLES